MDHAARASRKVFRELAPCVSPWNLTICHPETRHGRKIQVWLAQANLIRSTQTRQKSRFNGIVNAQVTDLAHSLVVEREEEEDQIT
jgi:hypothetical protein